jgi:tungstate transport system substrate-binding protein
VIVPSWGAHANKADFKIMVEGDQRLFNPYGVMLVDSQKCPNVRSKEGQIFIDWLISAKGQAAIASFTFDGKQLFFPKRTIDFRLWHKKNLANMIA